MSEPNTSTEPPPLANRRPGTRKRAYLGCTIVYGEGAYSAPCVIRDIAKGGARIGFANGHSLPSSFWLINAKGRTAHKARIAWTTAKEAGVAFETSFAVHQLPPELCYLKRFAGH